MGQKWWLENMLVDLRRDSSGKSVYAKREVPNLPYEKEFDNFSQRLSNGEIYKQPLYDFKDMNYDERKKTNINRLIKYINILYKYLNAMNLCFVDGSFIIEDNNSNGIFYNFFLLNILAFSSSVNLKELSSHEEFNPVKYEITDKISKVKYTCDRVCESHIKGKLNKNSIKISCNDLKNGKEIISKNIENVLWYKFNHNDKAYVYLKLEEKKDKIFNYLKKKMGFKGGDLEIIPTRNEDCGDKCMSKNEKDKFMSDNNKELVITVNYEGLYSSKETKQQNLNYTCNDSDILYREYSLNTKDNYGNRIGDEFFIPNELNYFFLKYAYDDKNKIKLDDIMIIHRSNTVYIYTKDECIEKNIKTIPELQTRAWAGGKKTHKKK